MPAGKDTYGSKVGRPKKVKPKRVKPKRAPPCMGKKNK